MTTTTTAKAPEGDSLAGFLYALSAYFLWGFLPLYLKLLDHASAIEVLAHRVVWSVPVALAVLLWRGRTSDLRAALRSRRMLAMAVLTAALVSVNWGTYVWAIAAGHTVDAALGYYINPLFSVLLGAALLGERLHALQWLAVALALAGVGFLTWQSGEIPVVALVLTLSWGFYAFFKRSLPVGPNQGFALEVILLTPAGLGVMVWFALRGESHFLAGSAGDTLLLMGLGLVTAIPLMLYANGAKQLRLSTIAMMQYIAPTMIFLIAVFWFREPFDMGQLVAFCLIWAGLAAFTLPMMRRAAPQPG